MKVVELKRLQAVFLQSLELIKDDTVDSEDSGTSEAMRLNPSADIRLSWQRYKTVCEVKSVCRHYRKYLQACMLRHCLVAGTGSQET